MSSFGENFMCEGKKMKIRKPVKGYQEREYPEGIKPPMINEAIKENEDEASEEA